jgi:dTDP-4-dehydrorhamnose reductase
MTVRVLVTGASGQVGHDLVLALSGEVPPGGRQTNLWGTTGIPSAARPEVRAAAHGALAVESRAAVLDAVDGFRPQVVFHLAAMTAVDACETDPERAFAVNAMGTRHVAEACRRSGAHLVYVSTDYVFDGTGVRPYHEWDATHPLSVYGRSKLGGEGECPDGATIVRTSWVCGASGANMVKTALRLAAGDGPCSFVDDQRGSPTFSADLAAALCTLGLDRRPGTFHVTNQGETTWYGFVQAVFAGAGEAADRVRPIPTSALDPPRAAPRPANSVLDNRALRLSGLPALPDWHDGLERLLGTLAPSGASA